ncbi:RNA polymerase sigma factor SigF, partial [Streptomyces sp. NPDC054849]
PPGAPAACAAAAPRTRPAGRPGRYPARATTEAAGASLPAGPFRAGSTAAHGAGSPAQGRPAGPDDNRTTGEVA